MDYEPAFPQHPATGNLEEWRFGMSLRDYFAAHVLAFMKYAGTSEELAKACYAIADAMLAERAK